MLEKLPRIYNIGPIHEHQKSRLKEKKSEASIVAGNFWEEDRSCIDWLNGQPPRSVIYVSFGSLTVVTREQLIEFWHVWSIVLTDFWLPGEVGSAGGGLNHTAVGAFLTHSGWNSTLESIVAGVPMICWPYFGDQTINSRFVSEVWKIGLDIKDTCDRLIIEKAVREVMEVRKDEFLERADGMAKMAKKAVERGGSSIAVWML
ncbi:hypothetical protein SASPL_158153 [Salvia splendens]|uniref:Uncharacterized protein n=1 Tax=Salvia splendens TaxID=180675 RepID=A0A8X8VTS0_SALSN|nr:hypothetical protein SASPL_158153 [Salvia splendens]